MGKNLAKIGKEGKGRGFLAKRGKGEKREEGDFAERGNLAKRAEREGEEKGGEFRGERDLARREKEKKRGIWWRKKREKGEGRGR